MAKVEGLERLKRRLEALPKAAKTEVRAVLEKTADEHVALAKRIAPKGDKHALEQSIHKRAGRHDLSVETAAGGKATTKPTTPKAAREKSEYDYALAQEFGTQDMPANPFFFSSWRTMRKKVRGRATRAMRKAVKKAAL